MKKIVVISAGIVGIIGIWFYHRDKKYPLTKGYYFMNKFSIPDKVLTLPNIKLANRLLSKVELPQTPEILLEKYAILKPRMKKRYP